MPNFTLAQMEEMYAQIIAAQQRQQETPSMETGADGTPATDVRRGPPPHAPPPQSYNVRYIPHGGHSDWSNYFTCFPPEYANESPENKELRTKFPLLYWSKMHYDE